MTNTALVQIKVDTETKTNVTSIYEMICFYEKGESGILF